MTLHLVLAVIHLGVKANGQRVKANTQVRVTTTTSPIKTRVRWRVVVVMVPVPVVEIGSHSPPQQVAWDKVEDFEPHSYVFDSTESGVSDECDIAEDSDELGYFQLYLNEKLMSHIVNETNKYYKFVKETRKSEEYSDLVQWEDTSIEELYTFLGLVLTMTMAQKEAISLYWNDHPVADMPFFRKVMSWERFQFLMHFLHFSDNSSVDESDRLWKIRPVLAMLNDTFKSSFKPYQNLAIGESSLLFEEKEVYKPKWPIQRHRFDTNVIVVCDCLTHVVLSVNVRVGYDENDPSGYSSGSSDAVAKKMIDGYLGKGHIVFTDKECTSPDLCHYLRKKGTGSCGSASRRCRDMPEFGGKQKSGACELFKKDKILAIRWADNGGLCEFLRRDKVMAYRWKDKGEVRMLSTVHRGTKVNSGEVDRRNRDVVKPDLVMDFRRNMPQKEKYDLHISYMTCFRRSVKWYKKIFFHLVDVAMLNACNVFRHKTGKKVSLLKFIEAVTNQLLKKYSATAYAELMRESDISDEEFGDTSSEWDSDSDTSDEEPQVGDRSIH